MVVFTEEGVDEVGSEDSVGEVAVSEGREKTMEMILWRAQMEWWCLDKLEG